MRHAVDFDGQGAFDHVEVFVLAGVEVRWLWTDTDSVNRLNTPLFSWGGEGRKGKQTRLGLYVCIARN